MKLYYLSVLSLLLCLCCKNKNLESTSLNSKTVSEIYFSTAKLADTKVTNTDYVDEFNFYNDEYLSIHFSLEQSLIKSLKKLAPTLSDDELLSNGNYQFSFLVDGETIYTENLNTRAGTKSQKTKELTIDVRFVTPERIDF